ncbi:hypothetical protein T4B_13609 [Trichinella pseudospiralis]|uniref:Uncharacterized protein n=2 Tax=Trichinella pseudospiralis TaxID=6337 RepID=A0A0V1E4R6_TRIPS|nr:hypothetical protein T4A_6405 [Trichinella pseudospiralis]KRY84176.1 hypothetical protein T4D_7401 [Trichinella pseudospiralis]KRZ27416.1 hypothetical protein T4B_13609 [Trichinella pseudospiralis]KRZ37361.1 hypothetical protein T4C_9032 [Trichinella pseudospiralis]
MELLKLKYNTNVQPLLALSSLIAVINQALLSFCHKHKSLLVFILITQENLFEIIYWSMVGKKSNSTSQLLLYLQDFITLMYNFLIDE